MISDFICMEKMEQSDKRTTYICSLPDPDISHEDQMVSCGYVWFLQSKGSEPCSVWIGLRSNFRELCVGEIYQRYHFVRTILELIGQDAGCELTDVRIILSDFAGHFEGSLHELRTHDVKIAEESKCKETVSQKSL